MTNEARYLQRVEKEQCRLVYGLYIREATSMTVPFEILSYEDFEDCFETGMFFFWRDDKDIYAVVDLSMIMAQPRSAMFGVVSIVKKEGYATEAIFALFRYGFRSMGLHRMWCTVNEDNEASLSLIEKFPTMTYEGTLRKSRFKQGKWIDQKIYSVLESEVEKWDLPEQSLAEHS
jgi:RimJ/RimL family protein N-acetyltransferase